MKEKMTVDELRSSGRIIYEVISGSHAYGTNVETSDEDVRGYYWTPNENYISLFEVQDQVNDEKNDIVYYDLKRAFDLLKTANPNQIELLWIPSDCIKVIKKPIVCVLLANRKLFISKKAYFTHAEYSYMQIKKAKGANKKVHNPQPETMPRKEDFCWVVDMEEGYNLTHNKWRRLYSEESDWNSMFPFRPASLSKTGINLAHFHVSSLEHAPNVYRMYYYGDKAKGVFRGDQMLCCESIPKEDERERFRGLLIYNQSEFERAVKDWHSYWDWKKNRNEARWVDQEKGTLTYDQKNMMHCVRLLISAENILTNGEPLVRVEGDLHKYLMAIRHGDFTYEQIMTDVEAREKKLKELYETSTIPDDVDMDQLNDLYRELMRIGSKMSF